MIAIFFSLLLISTPSRGVPMARNGAGVRAYAFAAGPCKGSYLRSLPRLVTALESRDLRAETTAALADLSRQAC